MRTERTLHSGISPVIRSILQKRDVSNQISENNKIAFREIWETARQFVHRFPHFSLHACVLVHRTTNPLGTGSESRRASTPQTSPARESLPPQRLSLARRHKAS